jgi:hypothetical protein
MSASHPQGNKLELCEVGKAVERDSGLELALGGQLNLPQQRHRDHKLVILNFSKQIIVSIPLVWLLVFLLADLHK